MRWKLVLTRVDAVLLGILSFDLLSYLKPVAYSAGITWTQRSTLMSPLRSLISISFDGSVLKGFNRDWKYFVTTCDLIRCTLKIYVSNEIIRFNS
jgi:hypothetical protein